MSKVFHLLTKGSITLNYDGKTKVVAKDDERYEKVLAAIRSNSVDKIPEIVEPELYFKKQGLNMEEGLLTLDGEVMPSELNAKIMEYKNSNLPFHSLVNFWNNLKQNPSFNSRRQLFKFLENKGHAITEDGCFIGYRGVTEDFKDKHTKTFDNSPGKICELPRAMVDDNPDNTCSHGLHVGGYEYAKDFGRNGKLVLVKVHPKDVVAVPNDYNGQKMRVCRFEVLSEAEAIVEAPVVNEKGGKDLKPTNSFVNAPLTEDQKNDLRKRNSAIRAHKKRYANNHAKRDKTGKFVSKKKTSKRRK